MKMLLHKINLKGKWVKWLILKNEIFFHVISRMRWALGAIKHHFSPIKLPKKSLFFFPIIDQHYINFLILINMAQFLVDLNSVSWNDTIFRYSLLTNDAASSAWLASMSAIQKPRKLAPLNRAPNTPGAFKRTS